jgi:hypothetical protein
MGRYLHVIGCFLAIDDELRPIRVTRKLMAPATRLLVLFVMFRVSVTMPGVLNLFLKPGLLWEEGMLSLAAAAFGSSSTTIAESVHLVNWLHTSIKENSACVLVVPWCADLCC